MSTKTPLLRLNIIPFDQDPWDDDSNENTSILDGVVGQFMAVANMQGIWKNSTAYLVSQQVVDSVDGSIWLCNVPHTSIATPSLFSDDRSANPTFWTNSGASAGSYAASAAASATAAANSAAQQGHNVGRNLVHNGLLRVQQRGAGPWTTAGYTADRWLASTGTAGGSRSIVTANMGDAARAIIGDEEAYSILQYSFTGGAGAGDYDLLLQRIENVRRLAGKTITVSFWAQTGGAGPAKLGINLSQVFGTGGAPSASVAALAVGAAITVSNVWTRYQTTITLPSVSGKTFGTTAGTDFNALNIFLSSGATNNAQAGNIGVQSGVVNFWGIQCEIGSVATPLEKLDPQQDLANCQRFYQIGGIVGAGYGTTGITFYFPFSLQVTMRAAPAVTGVNSGSANVTSPNVVNSGAYGPGSVVGTGTVTATGSFILQATYTASADL